jgi:hypothetical protein
VKESLDVESRPNFVGDGINAAQRIMDFAQPGQVTASRSFMESMSLLDVAYGEIFGHLGPRADKHGRQHELFSVTPNEAVLERMRVGLIANRTGGLDFDLDTPVVPVVPAASLAPAVTAPAQASATAPAPAPLPPSALVEPSWLPSQAAPEEPSVDEDTGPSTLNKVLLGVAATAVVVAGIVLTLRYMERDTRAGAPAVSTPATSAAPAIVVPPSAPSPTPATATAVPAATPVPPAAFDAALSPAPAPATAAVPSRTVAEPATGTAHVAAPERAPTPAANMAAATTKPQEPASRPRRQAAAVAANGEQSARHERAAEAQSPAAPAAPAAPERSDGRCSRIMQKASVGEPLSSEEKRELANTCR